MENSLTNFLGKISYGLYMFHPIAIVLAIKIAIYLNAINNYLKGALRFQVLKIWARRHQENTYNSFQESSPSEYYNNVQDALNFKELNHEIKTAILSLPDKCRVIFKMSRQDGMTQKQISLHLGVSQKTVEAHINKALKSLKSNLRHHFSILFL